MGSSLTQFDRYFVEEAHDLKGLIDRKQVSRIQCGFAILAGFRVSGSVFMVQGLGFRVQGSEFRISFCGLWDHDLGFKV